MTIQFLSRSSYVSHNDPDKVEILSFSKNNGAGYVENPKFGSKNGSMGGQVEKNFLVKKVVFDPFLVEIFFSAFGFFDPQKC